MSDTTLYQYCQKIVLLRNDDTEALLARRTGENDYDQTYAFIGGKIETTDGSIIEGLRREKNEEIGDKVIINICPLVSYNVYYVKHNGQHMIVPHYYATYLEGEIVISEEYDDFKWVAIDELLDFKPKVDNIPEMVDWALKLKSVLAPNDFVNV